MKIRTLEIICSLTLECPYKSKSGNPNMLTLYNFIYFPIPPSKVEGCKPQLSLHFCSRSSLIANILAGAVEH